MLILTIRTDKPESEIGLYDGLEEIAYETWLAHYELSETIHKKVSELLEQAGKTWHELNGVIVYKGPGSFTGLRIGIAFANTLAYSLDIPIIGSKEDEWIKNGIQKVLDKKNEKNIIPEYGAEVHITQSKK